MSSLNMPTKRDILSEHLFAKVLELVPPGCPEKVTGMLLERNEKELTKMLENPQYLQFAVTTAVKQLEIVGNKIKETVCPNDTPKPQYQFGNDVNKSNQSTEDHSQLCDLLFDRVAELEPGLCSQITGMLSELNSDTLQQLLDCDDMLVNAISKAKESYLQCTGSTTEACIGPDWNGNAKLVDDENVGDFLYERVNQVFPEQASKITGMLLEMDSGHLREVLSQPKFLDLYIQKAYRVLQEDSSS